MSEVRARFSPSPTGLFHVGGARTALFNWLYARQHDGKFLLRIEDTDTERNQAEWTQGILDALLWLGLEWDDDVVHQSQRQDLHVAAANQLYETGHAYYCDCTREVTEARTKNNAIPGYDSFCRDRGLEPGAGRALRFRVPDTGRATVKDIIRGEPTFEYANIEDFVIQRSNGLPLFILANVVDDRDMGITHVIRGEEHLPNMPKVALLWEQLAPGIPTPIYAHLPVLVNEQRKKLSKRRDKVGLEQYIEEGYLREAFVNYLALLGWSPGDNRELLSIEDLIHEFKLEDVSHSPAFFDQQKLLHFNAEYIRAMPLEEFIAASTPYLDQGPWKAGAYDASLFETMAPLVQERVRILSEVPGMVAFMFSEPEIDSADWDKGMVRNENAKPLLAAAIAAYGNVEWNAASLHEVTFRFAESMALKLGKAQAPIRLAITGKSVGPPLFESLEVLGRARVLDRLTQSVQKLG